MSPTPTLRVVTPVPADPSPLRAPRLPSRVGPSLEPKAPPVSPVRRANAHELAARERKVGYLAITAVQLALETGKTLVELVDTMGRWSDEEWRKLVVVAGQNPPSPTSREQVLARLRARAAQQTVVPPAVVTRYFVVRRPDSRYAWTQDLGAFDTREQADVEARRQRELGLTSGSGFAEDVWVEERRVRS